MYNINKFTKERLFILLNDCVYGLLTDDRTQALEYLTQVMDMSYDELLACDVELSYEEFENYYGSLEHKHNKDINRMLRVIEKWNHDKGVTIDDIGLLAYTNLYDLKDDFYFEESYDYFEELIQNTLIDILYKLGEEWNDYDPNYPNNLCHSGYKIGDCIYITDYSGVAGRYWNDESTYTICKW